MLIYHYTTFATFIDHILPEKRLRFNSLINTNDPKEAKASISVANGAFTADRSPENIDKFMTHHYKLYCSHKSISFCSGKEGCSGLGITSMWAHYGERHKGVCIEIDTDKLKDCEILYQGDIKYVSQIVNPRYTTPTYDSDFEDGGVEIKIANHFKDHKDSYFFEKNECWNYEQEYRIIARSSSDDDLYLDISDAMTCVYGGYDITPIRYDILYLLTSNSMKLTYSPSKRIEARDHWQATSNNEARMNRELAKDKLAYGGCTTSFCEHFKNLIPRFDEIFNE